MAGMLNLTDVLELIIDGHNYSPLAQEKFIRLLQPAIASLGDEMKSHG